MRLAPLEIEPHRERVLGVHVGRPATNLEPKTLNLNLQPILDVRLGLGQANHAIAGLENPAFFEELDSLKPFQHVSLRLDGAGSF